MNHRLEEAWQWTAEHLGTYLLPLEEAFELGRRKNARQYELHPLQRTER